ncbi:MAG: hypothetical protein ACLP05_13275 [Candidatus Kryptoniota bacterium]
MKPHRILLVVLVLFTGCDLFETRQPQPPQQGQSGILPPTTPDIVIQNLTSAIQGKNVEGYISCLSDNKFSFMPPSDVGSHYQSVFANWNQNSEEIYFDNLVANSSDMAEPSLNLYDVVSTQLAGDSAQYSANYTLTWPNKLSNYPQQVQGNLQLWLGVDEDGNWSIYRWIDSSLRVDSLTWSDMKARFYLE